MIRTAKQLLPPSHAKGLFCVVIAHCFVTLVALWLGALPAAISGAGSPVVQAPAARALDLYDPIGSGQQFLAPSTSHFLHIGITYDQPRLAIDPAGFIHEPLRAEVAQALGKLRDNAIDTLE